MTKIFKNMLGLLAAFLCLSATQIYAAGTVQLLVEATKTVLAVGETNVIYVTFTKTSALSPAPTNPTTITVTIPGSMTVNTSSPESGTTFAGGVWTIPAAKLNSQQLNAPLTLTIAVTQTTGQGQIFTPSAIVTTGDYGQGQTSSIQILVGCPFLTWGTAPGQVRIDAGNQVNLNDAMTTYNEDLAPQGLDVVFDGFRKNTPVNATPQYTARIQNASVSNLGQILQFTNATPQSNPSGNAPWTMISLGGVVDPTKVTADPGNYLEGKFTLDTTTYPNGLNGISFFIYDIDASPTNGWQDGVIVYGTDTLGNMVTPVTQQSAITTVYNVNSTPYSVSVGGKCPPGLSGNACLVNYANDNPRGRVTYLFPDRIRSFTVRYFRNSQVNSSHLIYLSSLYRGCGTDLELDLSVASPITCNQCFTYEVQATNNGPNAVGLAQVSGILPAGVNFVSATPSQGTFDVMTNKWLVGSLLVGQDEVLTMSVCADQNAALTTLEFNMELLGDGDEIDPGNNIVDQDVAINYIVVQGDAAATPYQTPVNVQWDANDFSVGGTLVYGSFNVLSSPSGTVTVLSNGLIQFTPNNGFTGNALVNYEVADSNGCIGTGTITIIVGSGPVTPPVALPNFAITNPITPVIIPVLDNDIPGTGALVPSTVTVVIPAMNGTTLANPDGTITYTPNQGFCGVDVFVYQVCDTNAQCAQAQVTVNVVCAPKAMNDSAITPMNTAVDIDVVANDIPSNFPLDPSTVSIVNPPSNGTVVIDPTTGIVTYTPTAFFTGLDSFLYQICDTDGLCSQATAFITVTPLNVACPSDMTTDGCRDNCFDKVVECLCNSLSFSHFTPLSGAWTQTGDHVSVMAPAGNFNFLRYDTPVDQSHQIMEVKLTFSTNQALTQFVSAGVATHWNGIDPVVGASVVYITFDNRTGSPANARLTIETHNAGGGTTFPLASIILGQTYTLRLVKNFQQTAAYLDDAFIGYVANTGTVAGNYIGLWAFGASVEFKDLTSCSYSSPLGLFNVTP